MELQYLEAKTQFKLFGRALISENSLQLWIHDCIDLRVSAKSVLASQVTSIQVMGAESQWELTGNQRQMLFNRCFIGIKTQWLASKALDFLAAWTMVLISAADLTNL